ncbi:MAG: outer membrane beta-barrel protein [Gemmatimonadales bacterium]
MKQLIRVAGIALLFSLTFFRSAPGQKTYALGIGGGVAVPVGKLSDIQKTGYNGTVALAIGVSELPIGVRFDGIYNMFPLRTTPAGGSTTSDLRIIGALGNLIYAFSGTSAKPYVVFGGGYYNVKIDTPGAKSESNFGVNAGLGATFGVGPLAMFFESRYHSIARKAAKGGAIQFVPITLGLMF